MTLLYSSLRSRDPQFQDGSLYDIGSVLQEQFSTYRTSPFFTLRLRPTYCVLCRHESGVESESALCRLRFFGTHSAQITVPVPSSVSVLPASNLGRYHSFANGFLSQTSLRTWGPCN